MQLWNDQEVAGFDLFKHVNTSMFGDVCPFWKVEMNSFIFCL